MKISLLIRSAYRETNSFIFKCLFDKLEIVEMPINKVKAFVYIEPTYIGSLYALVSFKNNIKD